MLEAVQPARSLRDRVALVARSMGVGAVATLVDLGTLALFASGLHWGPRAASFPALLAGIAVQFVGNKVVAFRDRSPRWGAQAALFLAVEALGFAANLALFDVAVRVLPLPYLATRLATTNVVYFAVCLPLWSRIFRDRSARAAAAPSDPNARAGTRGPICAVASTP